MRKDCYKFLLLSSLSILIFFLSFEQSYTSGSSYNAAPAMPKQDYAPPKQDYAAPRQEYASSAPALMPKQDYAISSQEYSASAQSQAKPSYGQ